jgi:hypothetical protein
MKNFYTAGNIGGLTFSIQGKDHAAVDVDFFRAGGDKPFFSREFYSKNAATVWVDTEIAKIFQNM